MKKEMKIENSQNTDPCNVLLVSFILGYYFHPNYVCMDMEEKGYNKAHEMLRKHEY